MIRVRAVIDGTDVWVASWDVQTSLDDLLFSARHGTALPLQPAAPRPATLRLVLAVRVDPARLQAGAAAALTCTVVRSGGSGSERIKLAQADWVWRPPGGRPGARGCAGGEGCWWEGGVPVGRLELFEAESDGPAQINLGEKGVEDIGNSALRLIQQCFLDVKD